MAKQITARRNGDDYQALFFWLKALDLIIGDEVEQVTLEFDGVDFLEDVVTKYRMRMTERHTGFIYSTDYYQCKYHVTMGGAFTGLGLIDPNDTNSKTTILQRLYKAYSQLHKKSDEFRLIWVSSWAWQPLDPMAKYISSEGSFRTDDFFNSGAGTKAGKIRSRYCEHLEVSETVLRDLISHVRFRLGENLTSLEERLWDKLRFACMHVPEAGKSNTIYCELAWRLLEQGKNILDAVKLTEIIKQEGLIERTNSEGSDIAIRSFPQTLRSATWRYSSVLDLMDLFDGRYVRDSTQWNTLILERIREFMLRVRSDELEPPTRFWFDCHLSICFLVGHLANPKSGWHIVPVQKSRISGYHLWTEPNSQESGLWKRRHQRGDQSEMILGISVSNRVDVQVEHFIAGEPMSRFERHFFEPLSGPGAKSVKDGADAWQLGYELRSILESVTSVSCHRIHLFMACPAALAFILGNCLRGIVSQFQLYEFDFEAKRTGPRYEPSFRIRSSELI